MPQQLQEFFLKIFFILSCCFIVQFATLELAMAVDPPANSTSQNIEVNATDALSCTLKRVVDTLTGPMGKAIASIAIVALGIGLFMGKLSWGLAVATAVGVAMIFGANSIVDWLSGGHFHGQIICD